MTISVFARNLALAAIASVAVLAVPAPAQAPQFAMLDKIQKGQWTLSERGRSKTPEKLCVRDPRTLLQLRHKEAQCSFFVIKNTASEVTVSYRCPSGGNGRTTVKYEDDGLLQIDSQGIVDNGPFAFAVEARYAGSCR